MEFPWLLPTWVACLPKHVAPCASAAAAGIATNADPMINIATVPALRWNPPRTPLPSADRGDCLKLPEDVRQTASGTTRVPPAAPRCLGWASWALEPADPIRRPQPGGAVEAGPRRAQVGRGAGAVATGGHVVERRRVPVRVGAIVHRAGVSGQRVDRRDDRGGRAGATDDSPALEALAKQLVDRVAVAVVDVDAGVGVRDRRDVGDRAPRAAGVGLPRLLRLIGGAAAARAAPGGLGPAAGVGGSIQRGAAHRRHVRRRGRILD